MKKYAGNVREKMLDTSNKQLNRRTYIYKSRLL